MNRAICFVVLLVAGFFARAQNSLSFYHLGDATYQNSNLNPAYIPEGRVFIGLPALSGIHVHINNKFSYNELIKDEDNQVSGVINKLQKENMLNAQANISLFHLGYRFPNGTVMSIFANERAEVDVLYPKLLVEFIGEKTTVNLGETLDLGSMGVNATHFREIGFGIAHQVSPQLKAGARVKMLQGFFNYSTPRNMTLDLKINPQNYAWDLNAENIMFRSSGKNIYGDSFFSTGNSGFAVDVGFEYSMSKYMAFSASITDIGFISWKDDIENRTFNDTTFNYSGVNIKGINSIEETLQDSLFDKFKTVETTDPYKTWLPAKAYGSIIYKYSDETHFIGTIGMRYIQGQLKMLYGGGIKQKLGPLTVSASAMRLPQHFFTIGGALAVRGGPIQYYVAADQLLNLSVPDAKAFDFRTGINIVIGRSKSQGLSSRGASTTFDVSRTKKGGNKGISTGSFLGQRVKTKKREGIYSIINRQKKREVPKSLNPLEGNPANKKKPRSIGPPDQKTLPKKKPN
ncbi:MAG: hypothetical protein GY816_19940 [Cytophagales bacterium]|nr:hypothetical protein [Cytophagales bacterium]